MGFFSGIKKLAKKALGFVSPLLKPLKGVWNNLTGKTAAENMARIREVSLEFKRGACLIWEGSKAILFWLGIPAILLCFLVAAPFVMIYNYLRNNFTPYI